MIYLPLHFKNGRRVTFGAPIDAIWKEELLELMALKKSVE